MLYLDIQFSWTWVSCELVLLRFGVTLIYNKHLYSDSWFLISICVNKLDIWMAIGIFMANNFYYLWWFKCIVEANELLCQQVPSLTIFATTHLTEFIVVDILTIKQKQQQSFIQSTVNTLPAASWSPSSLCIMHTMLKLYY